MEDYFETCEMAMVAYLRLSGIQPIDGEWRESGRFSSYWWLYDGSAKVRTLVDAFERGEAKVNPREYSRIFGEVKHELFGEVRH